MIFASARPLFAAAALLTACGGPLPTSEEASTPAVASSAQALRDPPGTPDALKTGPTEKLKFSTHAIGVQIYTCTATTVGGVTSYAWVFRAPEADLFDRSGRYAGNHFLGPTWQSRDGSKIVGAVRAQAPSPDPNAIPWLLLTARSTGLLSGRLSDVTSIQRLFTNGGKAPATGCDATTVNSTARVSYTADYYFYNAVNGDDCDD